MQNSWDLLKSHMTVGRKSASNILQRISPRFKEPCSAAPPSYALQLAL